MSTLAWSNVVRSALQDSSPFALHSISFPAILLSPIHPGVLHISSSEPALTPYVAKLMIAMKTAFDIMVLKAM
jgi:hypothetical protein